MSAAASSADLDSAYMRRALDLARNGWGQTAPNPMVGAVVVAGGTVVGEGHHARYGGPHAEAAALAAAAARARGATLYVTLEPCAHHGKTPPCVDAILAAGIARVVAAVRDPSDVARGGVERLRAAGVAVDVGVERAAAIELDAPFFNAHASDRPWVTLKLAISADGAIADPRHEHRWITGPASRAEVHRMRANSDAIAVGIGTVLADDPSLTVRDAPAPRVPPMRVVLDSRLRTPPDSVLARSARQTPVRVYATASGFSTESAARLAQAGVLVEIVSSSAPYLLAVLRSLREPGDGRVRALLVEGGARVAGALLREGLVDRLVIFQSRLVLGDRAPKAFAHAPSGFEASLATTPVVERRTFGEDEMIVYALREVPCSPD